MRPARGLVVVVLILAGPAARAAAAAPAAGPVPLPNAHAHNDYRHARPLLDALDHGFCSVEADIHLVDGRLLVAHDLDETAPERTLEALYLDPLRERIARNGGAVYPNGPRFVLLIDIKSDAAATYEALREVLREYAEILTEFRPDSTRAGAVTVIVSGNRPIGLMAREPVRLAGVDGRLDDLARGVSPHLMPLISESWGSAFDWRGQGRMPRTERRRLRALARQCHEQGKILRFWATPERAALWEQLQEAEVDLINADNLDRLQQFLLEHGAHAGTRP
ncbi:MAG: phosphatidylinositol-specific phospholipase C/glycerophosphodiester phosphodiesterase family protein [Candidatus Hydrogenedentes bacterium]|nr:phosphatidylinositol-specific phospholipase C/glycerophosphodiester phosphodiesterase family protein [Candidatus Hydrogenedentota bacterium]